MTKDSLIQTLREALAAQSRAILALTEYDGGGADTTAAVMFNEYARRAIDRRARYIRPSSVSVYKAKQSSLMRHIDDMPMAVMSDQELQKIADTLGAVYSMRSSKDFMVFIRMVLRMAMDDGIIPERPFRQIKYTGVESAVSRYRKTLTEDEQRALTEHCLGATDSPARSFIIAIYTGMRIGEIAALKWESVDFEEHEIHVVATRQRIYNPDTGRATIHDGPPKSKTSRRTIPMLRTLEDYLRKLPKDTPFVVTESPAGTEPRAIRERFLKLLGNLGIRPINFHALRHTFISNTINKGANVKAISEIAGHANSGITLDTYTHLSDNARKTAMNTLEAKNEKEKIA